MYKRQYQQWIKEFDRHVKPDEKSIKILAPSPYKVKREVEKIDPQTGKTVIGRDGKPVTETKEIQIPAFKVVSVFDVSQTEGKEIPGITDNELTGDVEQYLSLIHILCRSSALKSSMQRLSRHRAQSLSRTQRRTQEKPPKRPPREPKRQSHLWGDTRRAYVSP